jgi:cell division initiation protein
MEVTMITPSVILEKEFKTGIGYDKKEVEQFLRELSSDYEGLLSENENLKKKQKDLTDTLGYYKSIEKLLQKALILAEKTAQDTKATAFREADAIEMEAKAKANLILEGARKQIEFLEHKTLNLMQQYDLFKIHFENLLHSQIELLNSKSFSVNTDDFSYKMPQDVKDQELSDTTLIDTNNNSDINSEALDKELEFIDQLQFDFLKQTEEKSYQTEDGFEFFTMKDE